jgi:bifunctional non-homologous end joining protein LigD
LTAHAEEKVRAANSELRRLLAEGGDDLRKLPLHLRKTNHERLLARRPEGLFINPFERGEIGPDLFRAACDMGLEGLVWKQVKNRKHPAMDREL